MADNSDDEHLDIPTNNQSENPSDDITPTKDTETITQIQETENMEVHHHAHHEGKKNWKSYIWEFLMLFLAVFCGYLAEYQLEHTIEHNREKQFMKSLIEDLETDSIELKKAILKCDTVAMYSDSALIFLSRYKISDQVPFQFAKMIGKSGQRMTSINTDRTSSQLKNAGGMRLIRKKKISDAILYYWKQITESNISLDRYMVYRDASRSLIFKLWVIPEVYYRGSLIPTDSLLTLKVIDNDNKKWDELSNLIAISGQIARQAHSINLLKQLSMAKDLIVLIKEEYQLK